MIEVVTPTDVHRRLTALALATYKAQRHGLDPAYAEAKLDAYGEVAVAFGLQPRQVEVLARAELEAGDG